ncbi:hypothetical protein QUF84_21025 [Fictibacillus enclensis]|uniref:hypothetical protein n=1 Tax=Fictibacillus enclensis TaxID=1017270 RepID=UPI0025A303B2|nr:hypothetical protein [Fictibacillus enclensis]MDM5339686.1 hypothetical protein [Fictibacillus enclensis]
MKQLIITNIERAEDTEFLVAVKYGKDGFIADEIITPFEGYERAVDKLLELAGGDTTDVWTASGRIFKECLMIGGLAPQIKHSSDVKDTKERCERYYDILLDVHELKPLRKPSKMRAFLVRFFRSITKLIEGEGFDYEV